MAGKFKGVLIAKAGSVPASAVSERKMGRPAGKRTDPAFRQVSAWLRVDTYDQVKIRLLELGGRKEFSVLVQELLEKWLRETAKDSSVDNQVPETSKH